VNTALVITILNSGETSGGNAFGLQLVDLSLEPAFTRSEAELLENIAVVEVVQANLSACSMRPRTEIMGPTYLFPAVVGDGGKRGAIGRLNGEVIVGPHAVQVDALGDVAALQLVEDSKGILPVGHDGDASSSDGWVGRHDCSCGCGSEKQ
jgi:hypothetical protein